MTLQGEPSSPLLTNANSRIRLAHLLTGPKTVGTGTVRVINGGGDVYLPASLMWAVANGPAPSYLPWINLRPHVIVAADNATLEPIVLEGKKQHSGASAWHLALRPIIEPYQQNLGRTLTLLLVAVVLLLTVGCANCSILLTVRHPTCNAISPLSLKRWRLLWSV